MKAIVVAYDRLRGIGADNDLLWPPMPADFRHFKEITSGETVIMGRKTYESIGRPLPNRQNIVVSRSGMPDTDEVQVVDSLEAAYSTAEHDIYVIGGGNVYAQALGDMDIVYATEIDGSFPQATVFFPNLGDEWKETKREHHDADEKNAYPYDFVTYTKS